MKTCTKCGKVGMADREIYCPTCGSKELSLFQQSGAVITAMPAPGATGAAPTGYVLASRLQRTGAFFIDLIIAFLIYLFNFIPLPGMSILVTILSGLYWLFRDKSGASAGKRILRIKILSKSGAPASSSALMLRNLVFALPTLALVIPILGTILEFGIDSILIFIEFIMVMATLNRIGDRMAGTMVVKA